MSLFGGGRLKAIKRPAPRIKRPNVRRRPGPPIRVRGPRAFIKAPVSTDAPGDKPTSFTITQAEWLVYWWLIHKGRQRADIDFQFQSSLLGGRTYLGGLVVDFFFPNRLGGLVINVQGEYWHRYTSQQRANDLMNKLRLQSRGWTVVYVLEDALFRSLDHVMENAMRGVQLYADVG